ncbi:DUF7848 domain-containing protein [Streptomyces buecherae]|uniref:DUF7848 domain-containing protein n=1 Tax=Streptomyces buecherae TaxID=2763006 RepID=UPI003FD8E818
MAGPAHDQAGAESDVSTPERQEPTRQGRQRYGYLPHTIHQVPEAGVAYEAFCMSVDCKAMSDGCDTVAEAEDWAMRHTGRNPTHGLFRHVITSYSRVTRDGAEGR